MRAFLDASVPDCDTPNLLRVTVPFNEKQISVLQSSAFEFGFSQPNVFQFAQIEP